MVDSERIGESRRLLRQRIARQVSKSMALVRESAVLVAASRPGHAPGNPSERGIAVEVRVRNVVASCGCGSKRFIVPRILPHPTDAVFACASCRAKLRYGELLDQIGEQAMKQAKDSLALLTRRFRPGARPLR